MVSLQSSSSALLPDAASKRPPCLSLVGSVFASSTATSKKRKRDGSRGDDDDRENSRGEVVDGIELNFDAAPLPPEWQRCLDIKSGQIHYYNTRTQKRTWKDPRGEPDYRAGAAEEDEEADESANCAAPPGLDLELNLTFEPRRAAAVAHQEKKKKKRPNKPAAPSAAERRWPAEAEDRSSSSSSSREMVAAVCVRCHMLVMMCRASPACPNCKFLHPPTPTRAAPPPEPEPPAPLKHGLQLLCCRD